MMQGFKTFLGSSPEDQKDVLQAAADRMHVTPSLIEKDFWVSFILNFLFNRIRSGGNPRLQFKGGTSLSKGYSLINRFSEDIDITINRADLGIVKEKEPLEDLSKNQRKKMIRGVKETCSAYVENELSSLLVAEIKKEFPDLEFEVKRYVSKGGVGEVGLLFNYPVRFSPSGYMPSQVKIEAGARSEFVEGDELLITPYIDEDLADIDLSVENVLTVPPENTLWDKIYILHEIFHKKEPPRDPNLLSRHYYDVAQLSRPYVCTRALENDSLRESAKRNRILMFNISEKILETAKLGSFRLVPEGDLKGILQDDYEKLKQMIIGEPPSFDEVLSLLEDLENRLN